VRLSQRWRPGPERGLPDRRLHQRREAAKPTSGSIPLAYDEPRTLDAVRLSAEYPGTHATRTPWCTPSCAVSPTSPSMCWPDPGPAQGRTRRLESGRSWLIPSPPRSGPNSSGMIVAHGSAALATLPGGPSPRSGAVGRIDSEPIGSDRLRSGRRRSNRTAPAARPPLGLVGPGVYLRRAGASGKWNLAAPQFSGVY
jgi:hypothetical protein